LNIYAVWEEDKPEFGMAIIEIRPHPSGWKVFEGPGVEPVFLEKDSAIRYAEGQIYSRSDEIRTLDPNGNIERTIQLGQARTAYGNV
jgi:hypothetical protein